MNRVYKRGSTAQMVKSVASAIAIATCLLLSMSLPVFAGPIEDFVFGGNAPWFSQTAVSHDGIAAYQSGAISNSQSSWMETTVAGPGAVRYWWKVSSESCCDPLTFSLDGISQANIRGSIDWQSKAFAVAAGSHTLRWTYSTDGSVLSGSNAGWVDQVTFEQGSNIDVTPPVTTVTPPGGTVAASLQVALASSEPATIYYTTNGSDPTTASSQYSSPIPISSTTTLKYFALDGAGNYELTKAAAYTFDTTAPTTSTSLSGGSYVGSRSVSLYCSDNGMGCNSTYYCLGSNCTPATLYSTAIPITASTDLRYYSTDRGGNTEAVKTSAYTITADTTAPVTTPGYGSGTYGPFYTYLYCSDGDGSGCDNTKYCLGTGCTPDTNYNYSIYIANSTDFRFFSQDKAGNSEPVQTVSYIIDKTPPVTTASPSGGSYQAAPLVTLTCSDGGKGCSSTYFCKGESCSPSTFYSGPISINDTTVLRYYSRDNAYNNESVVTQTYVNPSSPKTITVPGMYSSIQAAIDAAYNGDTVRVAPGSYVENINFKGKAITVQSSDGSDVTVIDGNRIASVVTFSSGEQRTSVLNGFTIRNGTSTNGDGGGITISNASPTVRNCKVINNAGCHGVGIYVSAGAPLIQGNIIADNQQVGCTTGQGGGGVYLGGAPGTELLDNSIYGNNVPGGNGGGVFSNGSGRFLVRGNTIHSNTTYGEGGGIAMINTNEPEIIQNVISSNRAGTGGGIYWSIPSSARGISLVNNTIIDNIAGQGSGVFAGGFDSNAMLVNNVITAKAGQAAMHCEGYYDDLPPQLKSNVIYTPGGSAYSGICTDQNGNNGNITADPLLSNPRLGYYGLLAGSPAIDAGENSVPSLPATDLGGVTRIIDGNSDGTATVDIGAYEFDPARPVATLQGVPTEFLTTNSLTITVGGVGVVSYRYSLDGGDFTAVDTVVATPVSLTSLANGQHSLVVLGKSALGSEQLLSSATVATWVVNTETTNLTFTNGGDASWFIQPQVSLDGIAYQSGAVGYNQSSWMETTVTGPGAIRFWWKTSSQYNGDSLIFSIDGVNRSSVYSNTDWQKKSYAIASGNHTLRWTYTAGSYGTPSTSWLDQITFEQGSNIDVTPPITSATPSAGMFAGSQSVTLAANEPATIYYTTNGSEPTTASTQYSSPVVINKNTTLKFFAVDGSGNYELTKTVAYTFDTVPPNTYPSLSSGTYSGRRDVTLYCSDYGMGCSSTYYCLGSNCTPTTAYSSAITIISATDLRYYSVDQGGNAEAVKTATFTITPDVTAPVTTPNYTGGTYSPRSVYLSCSDGAGSGCASTYYCLGSGCTPATQVSSHIDINTSTDLRYYSVDRSGNSEAVKTTSYTIDAVPPVTTPSTGGGIYTTLQNVTLACNDGVGSGCSATYYCLGAGCYPYTPYSGPIAIAESTYLTFYSRDNTGNDEVQKSIRYNITATPPVTINVPADRATIQAGIDAANDGDTVLVAPGTYVENINFKGKAITVVSSGGADTTIIDGNKTGPVVIFNTNEWSTSVLDGFSIRNGIPASSYGGGVSINGSSPLLRNNRIINNSGCAAVSVLNGSPLIQGNIVANNNLTGCYSSDGGTVYLGYGSGAQFVGNTITGNSKGTGGSSGISVSGAKATVIRENIIRNNSTGGNGGGIALFSMGNAELVQNVIAGNSAAYGGGIYISNDYYSIIKLTNNTIVDNDASNGGGVYFYGNGDNSFLNNNIITAKAGQTAVSCADIFWATPLQLKNNLVFTPEGRTYDGICSDQSGLNGNISAEPQLRSAAFGYYGLRPGSPAIDAGDNSAPSLPVTDISGVDRLIDATGQGAARVDIGAYEFDPAEPRAVVSGAPAGAVRDTTATLLVSGTDIVSYRYAIDGGFFSTVDAPVSTPITLTGLVSGRHAVAVAGKSLSGEQRITSPTVAEWTIDTAPPVTTATPASGIYTEPQTVTLSCNDGTGSGCSATMYCLGSNCTPNTPYTGPITVNSATGLRYFSQDAFGYQEEIKTASYNFTGVVSGKVTDSGTGNPLQDVYVTAYSSASGASLGYGYTDSTGAYLIRGLASGSYKLQFSAYNYVDQWYNGKGDRSTATMVALSAPGSVTGIDSIMVKGGSISGTVTATDTGAAIQGVSVVAYNAGSGAIVRYSSTDSSGAYSITGLASGDYKINFDSQYGSDYLDQWYSGKADLASATVVSVTKAVATSGINAALQYGGSITGKVTDSVSGSSIQGVYVVAYDAVTGSWINSASTDSTGSYRLAGLSGNYKIRFSGSGYLEQWYDAKGSRAAATIVSVTPPNVSSGVNMVMVKGGGISGTVTDATSGAAIQGVSIYVYSSTTGSYANFGFTNANGSYSIDGLPTGNYKLRFSASDYVEQWYDNKADQSTADTVAMTAPISVSGINMALVKGASISGTVTDKASSAGLQNVCVDAYNAASGSWIRSACTDSFGQYSISGLASGSYKLHFNQSGTGYLDQWYSGKDQKNTATIIEVVVPNSVSNINVALERGAVISGTVTDLPSGNGIQNVRIVAYNALSGSWAASGYTDNYGSYSISGLATGNYKLAFTAYGYVNAWFDAKTDYSAATSVAVTAPDTVGNINMALVKGGGISGTITDRITGAGVANVSLYVINRSSGAWAGSTWTDSAGSYSISGLASGSYRLRIEPASGTGYLDAWYGGQDGYQCANLIAVAAPNVTTGIDASLDMGGSISGRITDAVSGSGIYEVGISLFNITTRTGMFTSNVTIDPTGAYTVGGLASGDYSLSFNASGYVKMATPVIVKVTAPGAVNGTDVVLTKGAGISGRVFDADTGEALRGGFDSITGAMGGGVMVEAVDAQTGVSVGSSFSDSNGNYNVTGLPSGSYKLSFSGREIGYGSGWYSSLAGDSTATPVTVSAPAVVTGINMSLSRLGAISGRVSDSATSEPLNSIQINAYDSITGVWAGSSMTNYDGSYVIIGLPSSSYRLNFTSIGTSDSGYLGRWYGGAALSSGSTEVAVRAPETTINIDMSLEKGGSIAGSIAVNSCPGPRLVNIRAYDAISSELVAQTFVNTDYSELFSLGVFPSGSYKLAIIPAQPGFMRQWYPNKTDITSAVPVAVTAGTITGDIAVSLASGGGSISGSVTGGASNVLAPVTIKLFDWYSGGLVAEGSTGHGSSYQVSGLPDSSYKLLFNVNQQDRWYRAAGATTEASPIVISGGAAITGVDFSVAGVSDGIVFPSPGKTAPDVSDALAVLKHIAGGTQLTPAQATSADVAPLDGSGKPQGNGVIDTYDVIGILRMAVGLM